MKKLKAIYPETKVVLQACGWMIINIVSCPDLNEDYNVDKDSFFYWHEDDEEDEWAYVLTLTAEDIRLFNLTRWLNEMHRFADKNRKIFCLDEYGNAAAIRNCVDRGDYIEMIIDNGDSQPLTIADVLEKVEPLDDGAEDVGVAISCPTSKAFKKEYQTAVRTVKVGEDGNIFFETSIDGEDVIACRLGERVIKTRREVFVDSMDYDDPDELKRKAALMTTLEELDRMINADIPDDDE